MNIYTRLAYLGNTWIPHNITRYAVASSTGFGKKAVNRALDHVQ